MSWISVAAIYFILWWTVLFAVLPFGVKTQGQGEDTATEGHDPGAPVHPLLLRKALATTVISAVIFLLFIWLTNSGLINLDDLPFYNTMPKP
jgi:predicted secreted protein